MVIHFLLIGTLGMITISSESAVLANLEKRLQAIQTLEANFIQIYRSASTERGYEEKGHLYLKRPDQMRWDYLEPEKKTFLFKGNTLHSYFYEDKQVIRQALAEETIKESILGLLTGKIKIQDLYSAKIISSDIKGQGIILELTPCQEQEIICLHLEVDPRKWLIRRLIFFESTGSRQEFFFSHYKLNPQFPLKIFEIPIPPDWEIIDSQSLHKIRF
ncbi:MAG: outer membrane lipoprotein carrier protein LolA [Candidatus Aminicenantes bacterium]|nr:outer membrane lipoprotein carrier protein LolA [Candidatus Aminicenantes bacterium]